MLSFRTFFFKNIVFIENNIYFFLGFSTVFFSLHLLKKKLPYYTVQRNILLSSLVSVIVGFRVGTVRAKACQAAWLAAEDKHTYLSEDENKAQ